MERNEALKAYLFSPFRQIEVKYFSGTGVPFDNELVSMQTLYTKVSFPDIYGASVTFTIPPWPARDFQREWWEHLFPILISNRSSNGCAHCDYIIAHPVSCYFKKATKAEGCLTAGWQRT